MSQNSFLCQNADIDIEFLEIEITFYKSYFVANCWPEMKMGQTRGQMLPLAWDRTSIPGFVAGFATDGQ